MTAELTNKEQVELLKKWWHDYGISITVAIVLGLCIGFGWRYWHSYEHKQAQRASVIYMQLQGAVLQNQTGMAEQLATQLMKNYSRSPYAALAAMASAQQAIAKNQWDVALNQFNWVLQHAKMQSLKQIARIRAARVLIAQQKPKDALRLLQTVDDPAYQPLIDQVKSVIPSASRGISSEN